MKNKMKIAAIVALAASLQISDAHATPGFVWAMVPSQGDGRITVKQTVANEVKVYVDGANPGITNCVVWMTNNQAQVLGSMFNLMASNPNVSFSFGLSLTLASGPVHMFQSPISGSDIYLDNDTFDCGLSFTQPELVQVANALALAATP